jgi:hypothetical protein
MGPSNAPAGAATVNGFHDYDPLFPDDWRIARAARVNLLVIERDAAVVQLLNQLLPDLNEPVAHWRPGQRLELPPTHRAGTMVLYNVGALAADEQRRLLEWLDASDGRTQVVSTASESLLPSVMAGRFLDTLYYRLNTIYLNGAC